MSENKLFEATHEYIVSSWPLARQIPGKEKKDVGVRLPYPFVPPCINGMFQELYYWDTYFTNRGLILDGHADWAQENVDDLIFLLNKFGRVPNSNSNFLIHYNSQPPYLHLMVKDIYAARQNDEWLKSAYKALKKEYDFWMKERMTPSGLNRHYHNHLTEEDMEGYYEAVILPRIDWPNEKKPTEDEKKEIIDSSVSPAESGMDFNPRMGLKGANLNPVDLNANLYWMENDLADFAHRFEPKMEESYRNNAIRRRTLMEKLMLGADGLYNDYDFVEHKRLSLLNSGEVMPFLAGLSNDKKAYAYLLDSLLYPHGLSCTAPYKGEIRNYQWGFPYLWPGENMKAFEAALKLGMEEKALQISTSFLKTVATSYKMTGQLWEAYDALTGKVATKKEYETPEMLGWTAGTFEVLYSWFSQQK